MTQSFPSLSSLVSSISDSLLTTMREAFLHAVFSCPGLGSGRILNSRIPILNSKTLSMKCLNLVQVVTVWPRNGGPTLRRCQTPKGSARIRGKKKNPYAFRSLHDLHTYAARYLLSHSGGCSNPPLIPTRSSLRLRAFELPNTSPCAR